MYKILKLKLHGRVQRKRFGRSNKTARKSLELARELGIAEQTLINWRKAAKAGKLADGSGFAGDAGTNGSVASEGGECAPEDGSGNLKPRLSIRRPFGPTRALAARSRPFLALARRP